MNLIEIFHQLMKKAPEHLDRVKVSPAMFDALRLGGVIRPRSDESNALPGQPAEWATAKKPEHIVQEDADTQLLTIVPRRRPPSA